MEWWRRLQRARREEIGVFGLRPPRPVGYGERGVEGSGRAGDDAGRIGGILSMVLWNSKVMIPYMRLSLA